MLNKLLKNKVDINYLSLIIASVLVVSFILFLVIGSVIFSHFSNNSPIVTSAGQAQAKAIPTAENQPTIFPGVSTTESQNPEPTNGIGILEIITRLLVSVLLAAVLAFRPRKNVHLFERNLYVAQTQILLAAVAGALMMIVGDNTARAFAIFAAVSLVRFRTNIRDPKEVTVLLICLALGLSAGVGRWDLGLTLCIFVLCLLWVLEYKEPEQAVRPMELTIKTRNVDSTNNALQKIFNKFRLETEVRKINAPDEGNPVGSIVHYLNLRLSLSTDFLSSQIITLDRENIEGIQWEQKKSATDIYQ